MYLRHWIVFLALAAAGCTVDLWTKDWIFGKLGHYQIHGQLSESPLILIDGVFSLETHLNEGALFGIGQRQVALFVSLSAIAVAGILIWMIWGGAIHDRLLTIALGLVMGGILGNLYDRLGLARLTWAHGVPGHRAGEPVYAVRDWLHFQIESIGFDWAIFNIADSLLVAGAALLLWHALWFGQPAESDDVASQDAADASAGSSGPLEPQAELGATGS